MEELRAKWSHLSQYPQSIVRTDEITLGLSRKGFFFLLFKNSNARHLYDYSIVQVNYTLHEAEQRGRQTSRFQTLKCHKLALGYPTQKAENRDSMSYKGSNSHKGFEEQIWEQPRWEHNTNKNILRVEASQGLQVNSGSLLATRKKEVHVGGSVS